MRPLTRRFIGFAWLALVTPAVFLGYGSDGDAWRVARAADTIWTSRHYVASRTTGFPLFEIALAPLIHFQGWILSNAFVVLCGFGILLALFRLSQRGHLRHPALATIGLAFLPILVKNSASTMDYVPALALLMWAYCALVEERPILSAFLIGLACGFRPTSGAFIVPCMAYTVHRGKGWRQALVQLGGAVGWGLLAYSPVLLKYGGIRSPYASTTIDVWTRILVGGYNGLAVFGIPQTALLAGVLIGSAWVRHRSRIRELVSPWFTLHAVNICVWLALFIPLMDEPDYLLPMLPSVIWMLDRLTSTRVLAITVACLLSYHVVRLDALGGESGTRRMDWSLRPGYTIADMEDRIFKLSSRRAATDYRPDRPTILMFGEVWITSCSDAFVYLEDLRMHRQKAGRLYVSNPILEEARLKDLTSQGFRIIIWKADKWEYVRTAGFEWRRYVEIVDDLGKFFGSPVLGRALTDT